MKKIFTSLAICLLSFSLSYSQNNGNGSGSTGQNNALIHWKLNGNNADNTHFFGTLNETDLIFKTYSTERLRISKEGNIGIGVEAPSEKLHIDGTIRLNKDIVFSKYASSTEQTRLMTIDENGRTRAATLGSALSSLYSVDCFQFEDGDGNVIPTEQPLPSWSSKPGVLYTGLGCPAKVAINSDSPNATLHVGGSGYISTIAGIGTLPKAENSLSVGANQQDGININLLNHSGDKSGLSISVDHNNSKVFSSYNSQSGKSLFHIYGSGNVEINGKAEINSIDDNSKSLSLKNSSGQEVIVALGNGTVGIGTSNPHPDYKLSVNGTTRTKRILVETNWADYVFADDYKLKNLTEIEAYIKANKHLPGIPTEKEILDKGLDVGTMQALQMEKIEELTLYIIELNKKVDKLMEENKRLKSEQR